MFLINVHKVNSNQMTLIGFLFQQYGNFEFETRLEKLVCINLKLSIKRISNMIEMFCFIFFENEMYFSSVDGIQLIVPLVCDNCLTPREDCEKWQEVIKVFYIAFVMSCTSIFTSKMTIISNFLFTFLKLLFKYMTDFFRLKILFILVCKYHPFWIFVRIWKKLI